MGRRILWVLCAAVSLTAPSRFGSTDERQPSAALWAEDALAPENAAEARLNGIQPPDQVLRAIGLQPGMVVGEIGAGRGRYTVQIAVRVGEAGKVYANDIDAAALDHLRERCARWGIANVETVPGRETDPRLPEGELDLLFMVSTYHHISQPTELMRNARPALKPEGRLAIVEWAPLDGEESRGSQTPPQVLERQMSQAGFALEQTIPFQHPSDSFNVYVFRVSDGAIAFYSTRSGRDDVYVMDADGSNQQRLTFSEAEELWPNWSPDGTQIAFQTMKDGNFEITRPMTTGLRGWRRGNRP